jgi:hypothetical protein
MDMDLTTRLEPGFLRATLTGKFVLTEARGRFLTLLDEMVRARTRRILIDGREVSGNPRAIERYLYGAFTAAAAQKLPNIGQYPPRFAYVLLPPVLDPGRLGETTARNRGIDVRAFDNVDDAVGWLLSSQF